MKTKTFLVRWMYTVDGERLIEARTEGSAEKKFWRECKEEYPEGGLWEILETTEVPALSKQEETNAKRLVDTLCKMLYKDWQPKANAVCDILGLPNDT